MFYMYHTLLAMSMLLLVNGQRVYLAREDMINFTLLDSGMDAKPWTIYIDEILYMYDTSVITNIEAVLNKMHQWAEVAVYWCNVPDSYGGLYKYNSEIAATIKLYNVSEFLPCGAIVDQFYLAFSRVSPYTTVISVAEDLHINITFRELHVGSTHVNLFESGRDSEGKTYFHPQIVLYITIIG